jgi:gluconate kinase
MLASQLADLETPMDAFDVDISLSPEQITRLLIDHFNLN